MADFSICRLEHRPWTVPRSLQPAQPRVSSSFVLSFVPVNVDFIASIIVDIFDDCNEDLIYSKNDPDRVLFVVRERK